MRWSAVVLVTAVAVMAAAGCGSGSGSTTSAVTATAAPKPDTARARGKALLDSWSDKLLKNLLLQKARADASRAGDNAKAAKLESQAQPGLHAIGKFGAEARKTFLSALGTPEAVAIKADGDAWSEWAYTLVTHPPAGDFAQARHIADLGAKAARLHQLAYGAVGAPVPPAFQSASG